MPTVVAAMLWKTMFDPIAGFVDYIPSLSIPPGRASPRLGERLRSWAAIFIADSWKTSRSR